MQYNRAMSRYLLLFIAAMGLFAAHAHELKVGVTVHGFKVNGATELPDISARMWRMEYERNGADLIWLEREDENRTFAIFFKTLPDDDTGIAHIMEHSVLCGSKRFPVKEPFVELLKSSLSTFLNAMTSADMTAYPVATKNGRDYLNLATVYLDSVFHPLSVESDWAMRQEGWHYEYDGTNLTRNGIVLSEMKASFANPDGVGYRKLMSLLFPDTTYGKCSGGDPAHIPELTFEKYRAFHARFYHPSNARIFLDGSIDPDATLALLDSYLRDFDRRPADATIPFQKPVSRTATIRYESTEERKKTMLWDGWVSGTFADRERKIAMDLLTDALADSNEAPLKRALLKDGLCEDVSFWHGGDLQQMTVLTVKNTDPEKADACRRTVRETIERLCRDGLDQKRIAALLDKFEFRARECDDAQRSLSYLWLAGETWLHGGDPAASFRYTDLFTSLRKRLGTGWYERTLREALLDNPHHASVTMIPDRTLAERNRAAERETLKRIRDGFTPAELEKIVARTRELKARQSSPDREEDIRKLPRLSIGDIPPEGKLPVWTESVRDGITVLRPHTAANGIVYLDLCFALDGLSDDELLDVTFLASVLKRLATDRYDPLALRNELDSRLGRFDVSTTSTERGPYLIVHVSALASRQADILRLTDEILLHTRYDDGDAIAKLHRQRRDGWEREAKTHGRRFAHVRAQMNLSEKHRIEELFGGISQLRHLQDERFGDLQELARKIFTRDRLLLSATDNLPDAFVDQTIALLPFRPRPRGHAPAKDTAPVSEGYIADGNVGYTAFVGKAPAERPFSGAWTVAARIVTLDYLWQEVRVKGGAYGGAMEVDWDGAISLSSWRDPNPARTFDTSAAAGQALADFLKGSPDIEKYQVSALARTDPNRTPRQEAARVRNLHLAKLTCDDLRRLRREIIDTTPEDLAAFAELLKALPDNASRCAFARKGLLDPCGLKHTEPIDKAP